MTIKLCLYLSILFLFTLPIFIDFCILLVYNVFKFRRLKMLYKNTFKLMFSNGHLIFKIMLYLLVALAIIGGLSFVVAIPIFNLLVNERFFMRIGEVYSDFIGTLDLKSLIMEIGTLAEKLIQILNENIATVFFSAFAVGLILFVLGKMVLNFYTLPSSIVVDYYMSSNVKQSMPSAFAQSFKKNILYQLASVVVLLPLNLGILYLLLFSLKLFKLGGAFIVVSPFIIIIGFTLLVALKNTIFCGWIPSLIVQNCGVFSALKDGFNVIKRRFSQTFANNIALVLTLIFLNVFGGVFTYGVGLIITIPVTILTINIFGLVAYYSANGQKYYLDAYNVMAPKTLEYTDKFNKQKYII